MADIKLIHEDSVLPKLVPLDWDVEINGLPYYVVRIEGFVHTIGGHYGQNCYWAYPRNKKPTYETLIEFSCDNPVAWGIRYEPKNYTKCKWDECEARSGGVVYITRNGKVFCDVPGKGINYGIDNARVMISELSEHCLELNYIDFDKKMIGRKVWWRSEPAVVKHYVHGQACVLLCPDGIDSFSTPAEFVEEGESYYEEIDVKTSIFDKHIWWWREEE